MQNLHLLTQTFSQARHASGTHQINGMEPPHTVHSYYEPVITVTEVLRSQCNGLDDKKNPHRWWNKQGDWKT